MIFFCRIFFILLQHKKRKTTLPAPPRPPEGGNEKPSSCQWKVRGKTREGKEGDDIRLILRYEVGVIRFISKSHGINSKSQKKMPDCNVFKPSATPPRPPPPPSHDGPPCGAEPRYGSQAFFVGRVVGRGRTAVSPICPQPVHKNRFTAPQGLSVVRDVRNVSFPYPQPLKVFILENHKGLNHQW